MVLNAQMFCSNKREGNDDLARMQKAVLFQREQSSVWTTFSWTIRTPQGIKTQVEKLLGYNENVTCVLATTSKYSTARTAAERVTYRYGTGLRSHTVSVHRAPVFPNRDDIMTNGTLSLSRVNFDTKKTAS